MWRSSSPSHGRRRNLGRVPTFSHAGFNLDFEKRPSGYSTSQHPIVLLHGLLLPRKHQSSLADALADRGNTVILLDLLGHGQSDRPSDPRHYRLDRFASQVEALLDHLGIEEAIVGGTSLGANVALQTAVQAARRVRGLFVEMPVLERAAITAGAIFVPLALAYRELHRPVHALAGVAAKVPRTGRKAGAGLYADVILDVLTQDPEPSEAVIRGLLSGEVAPHPSLREQLDLPALIVGHEHDFLHPFSDAEKLHHELSKSTLVQAESFFELRFPPNRLSTRVADFLDEVWL
jgi:pimeloyl-ACP methyl ester carboxylesterase